MNLRWLKKADGQKVLQWTNQTFHDVAVNFRDIPTAVEEPRKAREWWVSTGLGPGIEDWAHSKQDGESWIKVREVLDDCTGMGRRMTLLTDLKKLNEARTKGPWHIGHINESLDRGEIENADGIIIASDVIRSCEGFICAASNAMDRLLAVVEAAKDLRRYCRECSGDAEPYAIAEENFDSALAALEAGE